MSLGKEQRELASTTGVKRIARVRRLVFGKKGARSPEEGWREGRQSFFFRMLGKAIRDGLARRTAGRSPRAASSEANGRRRRVNGGCIVRWDERERVRHGV